jgi:hypothetical protein
MIHTTKAIVVASTVLAAFAQLYLATNPLYPAVFWIAVIGFAAAVFAGRRLQGFFLPLILFPIYLMPSVYVKWIAFESSALEIIWMLPLLGLIIADKEALRWSVPPAWRWPIAAWALVVSVSWPIVFLRELDFTFAILPIARAANTSIGITPWEAALNVTVFALGHAVGLLWIDALHRWFSQRPDLFRSRVLSPLAAAIVIACIVGVYQGLVDLRFLSAHLWAHMGRAAGTTGDANTFGMLAAFWGTGLVILSRRLALPWSILAGTSGLALAIAGVWTSGSRTALGAIILGLAAMTFEVWREWRAAAATTQSMMKRALPVAAALVVVAAVALVTQGASTTTVFGRGSLGFIPGLGDMSVRESARQLLWERNGYGPAAVSMIKEHELAGVGVGAYHTLVHDFASLSNYRLVPDNAQSWLRHLLAELGVLGMIPVLWWCVVFVRALLSRTSAGGDRVSAGMLRGTLVGFGLLSTFGMPGQSLPVILTFWTFAFWFLLSNGAMNGTSSVQQRPWSAVTIGLMTVLVLAHAGLSYADARADLRPRNRALRFGWDYRYGISDPEPGPEGNAGRMWTELRSLSQVPVKGKVLKFVGWIDHPDADERPVHVRVWADSRLVHDADLKRSAAIFMDIVPSPGRSHLVIETEISRTWKPTDFGRNDSRTLGLSVREWTWE